MSQSQASFPFPLEIHSVIIVGGSVLYCIITMYVMGSSGGHGLAGLVGRGRAGRQAGSGTPHGDGMRACSATTCLEEDHLPRTEGTCSAGDCLSCLPKRPGIPLKKKEGDRISTPTYLHYHLAPHTFPFLPCLSLSPTYTHICPTAWCEHQDRDRRTGKGRSSARLPHLLTHLPVCCCA